MTFSLSLSCLHQKNIFIQVQGEMNNCVCSQINEDSVDHLKQDNELSHNESFHMERNGHSDSIQSTFGSLWSQNRARSHETWPSLAGHARLGHPGLGSGFHRCSHALWPKLRIIAKCWLLCPRTREALVDHHSIDNIPAGGWIVALVSLYQLVWMVTIGEWRIAMFTTFLGPHSQAIHISSSTHATSSFLLCFGWSCACAWLPQLWSQQSCCIQASLYSLLASSHDWPLLHHAHLGYFCL